MQPFVIHKGKAATIMLNNIDTDIIIPKQYLKRIERTGFGEFLFDEWRYNDDRTLNPNFELNKPSNDDVSILITGENFGCGSSREHAPWALTDYGFKAIIAGSFADIFYNNAFKNGLLPIRLDKKSRDELSLLSKNAELTVDLENEKVVVGSQEFSFSVEKPLKDKLLLGLDDISLTLKHEDKILAYEAATK
jgi:3-isopropylmalate/(R)-2-methylmalate dehydratase small subunit